MSEHVTFEELARARVQIAQIINTYGEKYLPIFERLDNEYNQRKAQQDLLTKARNISNSLDSN